MARPFVYLVGAGPGDPGLMTVRARECLALADFVLYDQLVGDGVLRLIPESAERMCVRDLAGTHPQRWPHIHERMIAEARLGKCVVRLKGGDPLIFGRGGEEAEALREAGIPFEMVPGVTVALAAGSYLEIPLTHRSHASAVAIITGHEHPEKPSARIDWKAIAVFPGTLAIYMGISRLPVILPELIRHGKPADTPVAVISHVSVGDQRHVIGTLANIDIRVREAGLATPALVLVGPVVDLKPAQSWFESRPLLGARILVTRPAAQARELTHALESAGAMTLSMPAIAIEPMHDMGPMDAAWDGLTCDAYDWLAFTSVNGVDAFFERLNTIGGDVRRLGRVKLATIGSATTLALKRFGLHADRSSETMNAESLAEATAMDVSGKRVLLVQAAEARETLRERWRAVGASVTCVAAYRQTVPVADPEVLSAIRRGEVGWVTFTSPNIVRNFASMVDEIIHARLQSGQIGIVTNGPRISDAVRATGWPVAIESALPTTAGLVSALTAHITSR